MKRRNSDLCNIKAFLLFCVVLGHALERDIDYDAAAAALYRVLYLFHMPLFAFVSGLGEKSCRTCLKQARQAGKQYLCAQGLVLLVCLPLQPGSFYTYLSRPYWHLWYLLSLVCWHLLAGYVPLVGRDFSLSRTLVFFPFFLAGALWGQNIMERVSRSYRLLPLTLPAAAAGFLFTAQLPVSFLYQAEGYSTFGLTGLSGIEARLGCYLAAAACSVLVLLLCPKGKCALTRLGGDTLMPYLLHPVLIQCLEMIPYASRYALPVSFVLALTAIFGIHLCFKWERRLFLYADKRKKAVPSHLRM